MKFFISYLLLLLTNYNFHLAKTVLADTLSCRLKDTTFGKVCVCTAAYCDYLENPDPNEETELIIISSSKEGLRFATQKTYFQIDGSVTVADYSTEPPKEQIPEASRFLKYFSPLSLSVDQHRPLLRLEFNLKKSAPIELAISREKEFQKIVGFGGAFTGSVSSILQKLDEPLKDMLYKSYYHDDGIGYNMMRLSIGGSDFDLNPWAYNETPADDMNLSNFVKLDERDEVKIEQITKLKNIANRSELKIMAAAWSSPKWMKSNKEWTGYSYLLPKYYQTWADYHLRFLELMAAKNMSLWAISTGNEPLNGIIGWIFVRFMSLGWTPQNQAIWLDENLGPTIRNSKFKDVLIFSNDDQRYTFPAWFKKMKMSRSKSLDYIDGLAVHWYWDDVFDPILIDFTVKQMPKRLLISTESCIGDKPWDTHGPELGSWDRGEKYARALLQDLEHFFNGWIDWNLVLNEEGGPNYVGNYVDAAIIVNTTNQAEFYKQPMFYIIGHFSKFIPEGSVRIESRIAPNKAESIAFKRPDNKIVVIIFNGDSNPADILLNDSVRGSVLLTVPPHSIHSLLYN